MVEKMTTFNHSKFNERAIFISARNDWMDILESYLKKDSLNSLRRLTKVQYCTNGALVIKLMEIMYDIDSVISNYPNLIRHMCDNNNKLIVKIKTHLKILDDVSLEQINNNPIAYMETLNTFKIHIKDRLLKHFGDTRYNIILAICENIYKLNNENTLLLK